MKAPWFYAETLGSVDDVVELDPEEARHAGKAARLRPDDRAVLSDGQGRTAWLVIEESAKRRVAGRIEKTAHWPRVRPALHLASALPKGDRLATLISMATQIGIESFTPLQCDARGRLPGVPARRCSIPYTTWSSGTRPPTSLWTR